MGDRVSILLVGIGGYGYYYLKTLLEEVPPDQFVISGIVDPIAEKSGLYEQVKQLNIPIFSRIEDFYKKGLAADLVVVSSPIQFHVHQSCVALKNGSNVLCDKPIAATVQEVDEFIKVRDESGKWVMIGYQWSYSKAIQELKKDIMSGLFGKPIRLTSFFLTPRTDEYYQRNNWAGKIKDAQGRWVLDSPINNALAHFLHNMFYVLGNAVDRSAVPVKVIAESYRVNPIENYDTGICRAFTEEGTEVLFYAAHSTYNKVGPKFRFEFEDALITYGEIHDEIVAEDKNGNRKNYGSPDDDHQFLKLFKAIETVKEPKPVACGLEAARSQTLCMNGVQESVTEIVTLPGSITFRDESQHRWWADGVDFALCECYRKSQMPHEANYDWAKAGKYVDLTHYQYFPGGYKSE